MSHSSNNENRQIVERVNEIEVKLEYLQRDYETHNEMILVDANRILKLEKTVKRLAETVELLSSNSSMPKSPEDEKPPHY